MFRLAVSESVDENRFNLVKPDTAPDEGEGRLVGDLLLEGENDGLAEGFMALGIIGYHGNHNNDTLLVLNPIHFNNG